MPFRSMPNLLLLANMSENMKLDPIFTGNGEKKFGLVETDARAMGGPTFVQISVVR